MLTTMSKYRLNIFRVMLCLLTMLMPSMALADNVTFEGSTKTVVRVGEKFQLTYTLNASGSDMRMGETSDFDILMGPSQSTSRSVSIVNGNMTQSMSTTYTYILKAVKEGQFTIPPARVTVEGKQIHSNALTIKVVEASAAVPQNGGSQQQNSAATSSTNSGSSDDIIITQSLNRSSVYEGEPVVLTTKIYTRANLQQISDVKQPDLTNFVSSNLLGNGQLQFQQEVRNGVIYQAAVADKQLLIPQKSGKTVIKPIEYEFVVKERSRNNMGGFFGGFFDDVQLVKRRVNSNSLTLDVKPLPSTNLKTSGGVGDFKLAVTVEPTDVQVDNSVLIKISVSGEGNLKLLTMPKPRIHSDFDTFDPNENINVESSVNGYKGTRSAEYLVIPRREGEFEIPEISLVYFDPHQGKYITRSQGPFTIHVSKGDGQQQSNGGQVFSGGSREQVQYVGKDIRYVHTNTKLQMRNTFFLFSPLFFMCIILPLGVFAVVFILFRKKVADSMNVSGVKRRRANKAAMKRLKTAARYMKEQKREAFFDEVMRALWGYLSDKLTLPLSVLTKDNAKGEMEKHNISSEAADAFMQLLDTCEFARYAPVEMAQPMDKVYEQAENVIGQIEDQIKN